MTYKVLKSITAGLLTSDTVFPKDPDILSGLVSYALTTVATQADSLHLMTLSTTANVLRLAAGDYLIRMPETPVLDTDIIDIDEELTFAVARYMASYVSSEAGGTALHTQAAQRIILDYNAKTYEIMDQMKLEAAFAGVDGACYTAPSTEWTL